MTTVAPTGPRICVGGGGGGGGGVGGGPLPGAGADIRGWTFRKGAEFRGGSSGFASAPQVSGSVRQAWRACGALARASDSAPQGWRRAPRARSALARASDRAPQVSDGARPLWRAGKLPCGLPKGASGAALVLSAGFQTSFPAPRTSLAGSLISENGPFMSETGPLICERGSHMSENGRLMSENGPLMSENGPLMSENAPLMSVNRSRR
jgi:hypothetical protein